MNGDDPRGSSEGGRYSMSLRERQQAATRLGIVEAYLALSHSDGALTVSIPAVAERSGVSVRTVYRYFPNKDDLQTAAAFHMSEQALHGGSMSNTTSLNVTDQLKMLWTGLADNIPAVIAERTSPAARQLRVTRLAEARTTAAKIVQATGAEPDPETTDLLIAVTSSSMFLELVERMEHPPEVAAAMASRLTKLLLENPKGPR